jgi:hypothetical protein
MFSRIELRYINENIMSLVGCRFIDVYVGTKDLPAGRYWIRDIQKDTIVAELRDDHSD